MKFKIGARNMVLGSIVGVIALTLLLGWEIRHLRSNERKALPDPFRPVVSMGAVQPLPLKLMLDADKVALGRRLFDDARLSADNTIACSSCHNLKAGGVDGRVHSIGIGGAEGGINAPTVFNSGFNFVQFWDGRAPTLEAQVDGPVNNPKEMGSNWPQVIDKLNRDETYRREFGRLYSDGLTPKNIKQAIATFERSLVTPNAPFDRFLRGDSTAMSEAAQHGYQLFQSYGCISCHQGVNLGGNMFERMGLMGNYFEDRGNVTVADAGRFNVTGDERNRHEFKVPALRNVALTSPYFHDGSVNTLPEAVSAMARYQLGRQIPEGDISDLVQFLYALSGETEGLTK